MTLTNRYALGFLAAFIFCLSPLNLANADQLKHQSTFSYTEFNKPVFIGELHSLEGPVDTEILLTGSQPFEMRMLVEARSLSSRRFKKLWLEGVAINSPTNILQLVNKDLARFSNLFKGRLLSGDLFQARFTSNKATVIKLNGITLDTINNPNFGPILLSSWIGDVPLSSTIKDHIAQSIIDPDANSRRGAQVYSKVRQATVQNWLDPAPAIAVVTAPTIAAVTAPVVATVEVKPAANKESIEVESSQAKPAKPELKIATETKSTLKPVAIPKPAAAPKPAVVPNVITKAPEATKVAAAKTTPTPTVKATPIKVPAVKPQPKPVEKAIVKAPAKTEAKPSIAEAAFDEEEEETQVEETEEILALRQSYYQSLVTHLQNFKTIPYQAFQRRWTGEVRLYVVIDKTGNVLSQRFIKEDRRKVFNTQAQDALKRAAPFPPIPTTLQETEFSFSVPLQYRLD